MRDGYDCHVIVMNEIDQCVWEAIEAITPRAWSKWMPSLGAFCDAVDTVRHRRCKFAAKPIAL